MPGLKPKVDLIPRRAVCLLKRHVGAVCITSWYPQFNVGHFGLPPSPIYTMTRLGSHFVLAMTRAHMPIQESCLLPLA